MRLVPCISSVSCFDVFRRCHLLTILATKVQSGSTTPTGRKIWCKNVGQYLVRAFLVWCVCLWPALEAELFSRWLCSDGVAKVLALHDSIYAKTISFVPDVRRHIPFHATASATASKDVLPASSILWLAPES
jgi:hypothetical protein